MANFGCAPQREPFKMPPTETFNWTEFVHRWRIAEGCTYLNHGSFGPSPLPVQEKRMELLAELESQPMEFLIRTTPRLLKEATQSLAAFLNCEQGNLAFVPNATEGMNVVAKNVPLAAGDEVLLTDHEYGAVVRIWGNACKQVGAKTVLVRLPQPLQSKDEVVEAIFAAVTEKTRILVVSHVTSPTAVILPVQEICQRAKQSGLMVVIDGPHAPVMVDVDLRSMGCDFYCASTHKWLCAPFGTGFLYVKSKYKQGLVPNTISWGRSLQGDDAHWTDEFHWPGTFDPTGYLSIPTAIQFFKEIGLKRFREQTHALAKYARERLLDLTDRAPLSEDSEEWYGSMVTVPFDAGETTNLKPGEPHPLQKWLATEHQLEVPVFEWHQQWHVRVSCQLYNTPEQIDLLVKLLQEWKSQTG